jgi:hypothetical protein
MISRPGRRAVPEIGRRVRTKIFPASFGQLGQTESCQSSGFGLCDEGC